MRRVLGSFISRIVIPHNVKMFSTLREKKPSKGKSRNKYIWIKQAKIITENRTAIRTFGLMLSFILILFD